MESLVNGCRNLRELDLLVQSGFWKGFPGLVGVIFAKYCQFIPSPEGNEFGTADFWNAVLGDDDELAIQSSDEEETTVQSMDVEGTNDQSLTYLASDVEGTTVQSSDVEGTTVQSSDVEGTTVQSSDVEGTTVQSSDVEGTTVQSSDVEGTTVQSSDVEGTTVQSSDVEGTTVQSSDVEGTTVQSSDVEGTTVQSSDVEGTTVQSSDVEGTTVQSSDVEGTTDQSSDVEGTTDQREWLTEREFDAMFGAGASASLPVPESSHPLSHFYTLDLQDEVKVKRFGTKAGMYLLKLRNLEEVSDVDSLLNDILASILEGIKNPEENTLLGISIDHPAMDKPFNIPFQPQRAVSSESVLRVIQKIMQSNKEVALDAWFEIRFVMVTPPNGKGDGKKRKYCNNWTDWMKAHTGHGGCFIKIESNDTLCCARALVVAKAKADQDPRYLAIRKNESTRHHEQRRLAKDLMRNAGLGDHQGGCGIPELRQLQQYLSPEYQIKVFWKEGFNGLLFKGPPAPTVLSLYLHDDHYDVITSVPAFFDNSFYCHDCDKAYHIRHLHRCQSMCPACRQPRTCPRNGEKVFCNDCNRCFFGRECFELHKERNVCAKVRRCKECHWQYVTEKGRHRCGTFWCRSCRIQAEIKGHSCYIQPIEPSRKPNFDTFIFFDFETSQDQVVREDNQENRVFEHHVNACVVQKVCFQCKDQPIGECPRCGPNQIIFRGPNTLADFCTWLFHHQHKDCLALAHNAKAFDSQFILNYLQKQAVKPEVVCRGLKILCLEVGCIKIIDSLSFLPMPLSALPKAFNIKELKKGFFPHLFNRRENWDYHGPMPAIDYFDPDNMKPKQRKEFERWYQDNQHKDFDFQEELISYCVSDVDILRKACLSFMEAFQKQTNVQPFDKAITIAQACQIVYRQNFLPKETIALVPHGGYRWKDKFSATAIKWLKWISERENVAIRHAINGGEVRVGPYKVDGIAGNRVFEFHGCPFHGCPTCFPDRDKKLPLCSMTVEEAYLRTLDRRRFIEQQGYEVEELWSCQLKAQLDEDPEMKAFFKNQHLIEPLDPRDAFYGGRTNAIVLYRRAEPGEKINYADVCSLYPYICKYGKFPIGHPDIITEGFLPIETKPYEGLIKCTILPPRGLHLPVLPFRSGQKLLFPLCRTCAETRQQEPCQHPQEDRAIEGVWVTEEVYKAIDLGYRILKVHEVWHYQRVMKFDGKDVSQSLFGEYINNFLKLKTEASGWPPGIETDHQKSEFIRRFEEREGISLDPANIERNEAYRALAKLMLNSFWGKFGQKDNMGQTKFFTDPAEYFDCVTDPANVVSSIRVLNNSMMLVNYSTQEEFIKVQPNTSVVIACYVTAQARLELYRHLEPLNDRVLYMDTDSVVYVTRPTDTFDLPTGDFMGDLTDELADFGPGSYISEFVSGGPKNYAFKVTTPGKDQPSFTTKVRGFTLTSQVSNLLNFDTLKQKVHAFVESNNQESFKVINRKFTRRPDHSVITEYVPKTYRVVYDKRKVMADFSTQPFGF